MWPVRIVWAGVFLVLAALVAWPDAGDGQPVTRERVQLRYAALAEASAALAPWASPATSSTGPEGSTHRAVASVVAALGGSEATGDAVGDDATDRSCREWTADAAAMGHADAASVLDLGSGDGRAAAAIADASPRAAVTGLATAALEVKAACAARAHPARQSFLYRDWDLYLPGEVGATRGGVGASGGAGSGQRCSSTAPPPPLPLPPSCGPSAALSAPPCGCWAAALVLDALHHAEDVRALAERLGALLRRNGTVVMAGWVLVDSRNGQQGDGDADSDAHAHTSANVDAQCPSLDAWRSNALVASEDGVRADAWRSAFDAAGFDVHEEEVSSVGDGDERSAPAVRAPGWGGAAAVAVACRRAMHALSVAAAAVGLRGPARALEALASLAAASAARSATEALVHCGQLRWVQLVAVRR